MLVPFLFELRAVMDWIWTDTSMTIMDWFKMEDIFASIYQIKVSSINIYYNKRYYFYIKIPFIIFEYLLKINIYIKHTM